jgi:hypothetical protein
LEPQQTVEIPLVVERPTAPTWRQWWRSFTGAEPITGRADMCVGGEMPSIRTLEGKPLDSDPPMSEKQKAIARVIANSGGPAQKPDPRREDAPDPPEIGIRPAPSAAPMVEIAPDTLETLTAIEEACDGLISRARSLTELVQDLRAALQQDARDQAELTAVFDKLKKRMNVEGVS